MKLYFFDYKNYGEQFLVMETTPQNALKKLKEWMVKTRFYEYGKWKHATLDKLPDKYFLVEKKKGEVVRTEIA